MNKNVGKILVYIGIPILSGNLIQKKAYPLFPLMYGLVHSNHFQNSYFPYPNSYSEKRCFSMNKNVGKILVYIGIPIVLLMIVCSLHFHIVYFLLMFYLRTTFFTILRF